MEHKPLFGDLIAAHAGLAEDLKSVDLATDLTSSGVNWDPQGQELIDLTTVHLVAAEAHGKLAEALLASGRHTAANWEFRTAKRHLELADTYDLAHRFEKLAGLF